MQYCTIYKNNREYEVNTLLQNEKRGDFSANVRLYFIHYHSNGKGTRDNFREKLPKHKSLLHLLSFWQEIKFFFVNDQLPHFVFLSVN